MDGKAATHNGSDQIEKLPPMALEAEAAVLGVALVCPEGLAKIVARLRPEMFYRRRHQTIFAAILELNESAQPVDMVSVSETLKAQDRLESAGGRQYITDLGVGYYTSAYADWYARKIRETWARRCLIKAAEETKASAYDHDISKSLSLAQELISQISRESQVQEDTTLGENALNVLEIIQKRADPLTSTIIPSGFRDLDKLIYGFDAGEVVIVAGRPSMGKSCFVSNIAEYMAETCRRRVAFFSLEMTREQVTERMLLRRSRASSYNMKSGQLTDDEKRRLTTAYAELEALSDWLKIFDPKHHIGTDAEIIACLRHSDAKPEAAIIDYTQMLSRRDEAASQDNRNRELELIFGALKEIAIILGIPIIALSQLSRAVEQRQNKRPMLSDLRDSGAIEQYADKVIALYRDEYYNPETTTDHGIAEAIVLKHRGGPIGTAKLRFRGEFQEFSDISQYGS